MAGLDIKTPALTLNRLCGSGFQSVISAAQDIILGEANVVLAGGTESMSQAPYVLRNVRWGTRYGQDLPLQDTLANALIDTYPKTIPMGITAENLGKQYNISRKEVDEYALQTQQRWAKANANGEFASELCSVEIKSKKGSSQFTTDEHPRPETTMATLGKLPAVFVKDGVVSAGNASGICDGAASLIVASGDAVREQGLTPLAKILSWYYVGVEPSIMGIGPVPAIRGALKRAGLQLKDMDLVEVNEAFGVQFLAVQKELGLDNDKSNVCGG
jgi:acetyl-CoA acyltransferase 2